MLGHGDGEGCKVNKTTALKEFIVIVALSRFPGIVRVPAAAHLEFPLGGMTFELHFYHILLDVPG